MSNKMNAVAPNEGARLTGHSGNDEIGTPADLYRWLNRRFDFNYDAAASYENFKLPDGREGRFSTQDGTYVRTSGYGQGGYSDFVGVTVYEESPLDGLTYSWDSLRVFCNPPYSSPLMRQFIEKAIAERNAADIIVLLVKYDASTVNGRLLREHFHLEYLPRVKYEGMAQAATFPSVVAIAKPDWKA